MSTRPFVSFVGAGPGDPELVTLKALRRLRGAEVVIHDRLIPAALLDEAPATAEVIDAGKAPGRPCMGQSQINWLLVDRARRRGRVVRLKGGDPAVFGRLAEEIVAVRAAAIEFEVVPGVTAATAVAARTGISLTARGHASMLIFATGSDHAGRGTAALDWELLARAEATLVFYMPVQGLEGITTALTALGRDARERALVVERAGTLDERVVAGRLGDIAARCREAAIGTPALLLVGPTLDAASVPLAVGHLTAAEA
ncbi:MAG TPA: uroporphyrinogen-III C-methyltransferase [Methylomirabilota bacterium]|nr:uroporphyrinogen-III C-methyltransferase [Methylomirabilota bacterium]